MLQGIKYKKRNHKLENKKFSVNVLHLKDRKAVSVIIGYVLLISLAVVMGGILYTWMRSYVPTEKLDCPEGTSISVYNYSYNCSTSVIDLTIKNNGRFDIGGYFIKASNSSNQSVATVDLSKYLRSGGLILSNSIKLGRGIESDNSFIPNSETTNSFNISGSGAGTVYKIELIPFRWQKENNKLRLVSCGTESNAKENIICS